MSQNNNKSDYANAGLVLLMAGVVVLMYYSHYFFYYFLYVWRAFIVPISFAFQYIPEFILNIVFFWVDGNKQETFAGIFKLTMKQSNHFFNENRNSYDFINAFMSKTIGPFIYAFFLYTSYIIYKKKTFNAWLMNSKGKTAVDKLIEKESEVWPNVKFLINEHPELEKDIHSGKWRVAETPEKFLVNRGLYKDVPSEEEDGLYTIDVPKLREELKNQLGKQWLGYENTELTKYERQILAIISLKMLRNGKESLALKKLISSTYSTKKIKPYQLIERYKKRSMIKQADKWVEKTLSESSQRPEFKELESKHAYFYTFIMEMLELSRKDGVAATDYIWLRVKDRMLYMVLNNTGRRVAFSEVAGPWAHRIAEKEKNVRINSPKINQAIIAFDAFVEQTDYKYVSINSE